MLWEEHSCFCSSLWKRLGVVGLNGDPGRAVVLSYQRAAIFGFQILIVKQISFDSSAAGQNSIMCWLQSLEYMTILELSLFVIDYLSTVPLWNQGSKCNSVSPIEPLACVLKHIGIGPLHFQNSAICRYRISHWTSVLSNHCISGKEYRYNLTHENPELASCSGYHQPRNV